MSVNFDLPDYMAAAHKARRMLIRGSDAPWMHWPAVVVDAPRQPHYQFLHATAPEAWRFTTILVPRRGKSTAIVATFFIQDPRVAFEFKMRFA